MIGLVAISMVAGAVDIFRHPGWAWKRAGESRIAYLVLVLLLPLVGLGMYLFGARPKVVAIAAGGRAASLPFERFGQESVQKQKEDGRPLGTIAAPAALGSFGEIRGDAAPAGLGGSVFSAGGTSALHSPVGLARAYRPRQRESLPGVERVARPAEHRDGEHDDERPLGLEGRPDRPSRVPLLGRRALDRERLTTPGSRNATPSPPDRRSHITGTLSPLSAGPSVPPSAALADQPAEAGHQHLEDHLPGEGGGTP